MKQIYYRGSLKSCNYHCEYCPFSKNKRSERQRNKDQKELTQFVTFMGDQKESYGIQITPYGEALIHDYYWEALAKLSQYNHVEAVGAQTNLSFSVSEKLAVYGEAGGDLSKLRLWGTFHPTMCRVEDFLRQCELLEQESVLYCVGSVGVPEHIVLLQQLRQKLNPQVYLWVNRMDGLGRPYSPEEIRAFSEIDTYFHLELRHLATDVTRCKDSVFVRGDGTIYGCNECHQSMGNIYAGDLWKKEKICTRKYCECYLSYGGRSDVEELEAFQPYPAFRIPHIIK